MTDNKVEPLVPPKDPIRNVMSEAKNAFPAGLRHEYEWWLLDREDMDRILPSPLPAASTETRTRLSTVEIGGELLSCRSDARRRRPGMMCDNVNA